MDWFRPALGSVALLALTLALFFGGPLLAPVEGAVVAGGAAASWAFALGRIAVLLAVGYALARVTGRGQAALPVALLVAGPSLVVGGLMGVAAALRPVHLLVVLALAAGLLAAAWLGARQGEAR